MEVGNHEHRPTGLPHFEPGGLTYLSGPGSAYNRFDRQQVTTPGAIGDQYGYFCSLLGSPAQLAAPPNGADDPGALDPHFHFLVVRTFEVQPDNLGQAAGRLNEAVSRNDSRYREHDAPIRTSGNCSRRTIDFLSNSTGLTGARRSRLTSRYSRSSYRTGWGFEARWRRPRAPRSLLVGTTGGRPGRTGAHRG